MELTITGRHVEVTQSLRECLEKKLSKLQKYINKDVSAHAVFSEERGKLITEITINDSSNTFRSRKSAPDTYASIDLVVDTLEQQIKKHKDRLREKRTPNNKISPILEATAGRLKRRRVSLEPISVEEAISRLDNSDETFLAFIDIEDRSAIKIIHQSLEGDYEIIEPYL